jgi:hypothetical protein
MTTGNMTISVSIKSDHLRILLDGVLHLSIDIRELVGIQSWKYGNYRFAIEYSLKTTSIETWYVAENVWKEILVGIEELRMI